MRKTILINLFFITTICFAQTKVIAHKSHSGSKNSFAKAYQNNLFDIKDSNFGLPEHKIQRLDTIIAINDSTTVLKYRVSKTEYHIGTKFENIDDSDIIKKTQTLKNDRLINKKNTIKYIKSHASIFYNTPIDEVVFIGFKKA